MAEPTWPEPPWTVFNFKQTREDLTGELIAWMRDHKGLDIKQQLVLLGYTTLRVSKPDGWDPHSGDTADVIERYALTLLEDVKEKRATPRRTN